MKTFKEFILDENLLAQFSAPPLIQKNEIDINGDAYDEINKNLMQITSGEKANPFISFNGVARLMAEYGVVLPQFRYHNEPEGEEIFEFEQFGEHSGVTTDPLHSGKQTPTMFLYFCYAINENGFYESHAVVVDKEGLDEILSD